MKKGFILAASAKKGFVLVAGAALLAIFATLMTGCAPEGAEVPALPAPEQGAPASTDEPTSTATSTATTTTPVEGGEEEGNFRLLISDEVNAIEDFEHLHITISGIGVHQAGEDGGWHEIILDPEDDLDGDGVAGVDLRPLEGENALKIWSGDLEDGEYNKVFIYVDNVTGILVGGETADVKLPSQKLQISKPFTIGDSVVDFVYDITVVQAGKSDKYNLKPQIAQSGADQSFNEVGKSGKPEEEAGDITAPVIDVSGVGDGEQYTDPVTPVIEVSDETDPDPVVTITLDGVGFASGSEISEVGEYELEVTAVDASGNEAEVAIEFEIVEVGDTTAPVIDVSGVGDGEQYTEPVTPVIEVLDETDPDPVVTIILDGVGFASGTEISEVGVYELEVTAVDASGNEAEVTIEFEIVEVGDTTAPVIDVSGVGDGEQYTESVTPVIEVLDDTDPDPAVTITLDGVGFASGTEISEVGVYELEVTAVDASGNEAEVTIAFEIVEG
jgi:hypothetical protein